MLINMLTCIFGNCNIFLARCGHYPFTIILLCIMITHGEHGPTGGIYLHSDVMTRGCNIISADFTLNDVFTYVVGSCLTGA